MSEKRKRGGGPGGDVAVEEKVAVRQQVKRPRLYRVILHNDDFTPREFVVMVLEQIFHKSESDAVAIMLVAHTTGYAVAGVFTREIAETKVDEVMKAASAAQFPLLCTMEPGEDGDAD
jgi:ATP-dependent Clp protease adaptor protein ClpS